MENARKAPQVNFRVPAEIKVWMEGEAKRERMSLTNWLIRLIEKAKDSSHAQA